MFPKVDVFERVKYADGATRFSMAKPPVRRSFRRNKEHETQYDLLKDRENKCPNSQDMKYSESSFVGSTTDVSRKSILEDNGIVEIMDEHMYFSEKTLENNENIKMSLWSRPAFFFNISSESSGKVTRQ